jgi:hypothetical protein
MQRIVNQGSDTRPPGIGSRSAINSMRANENAMRGSLSEVITIKDLASFRVRTSLT